MNLRPVLVRARLAVVENRAAVAFVAVWLVAAAILLARLEHVPLRDAALLALCLRKVDAGPLRLYQSFTEVVVFGVVASVVVTNVTQRHRPERTARALASEARGHVVVVGMSNLGRRVLDLVAAAGRPVVAVDTDLAKLADVVERGGPAVVGDATHRDVLEAAAVARAKVVVLATDDLETVAVAARLVRESNPDCELVLRCADDDVGAVLGRTHRARVVSTSTAAGGFVLAFAQKHRAKEVVVLGRNAVAAKVSAALASKRVPHVACDLTEDRAELERAGVARADLVVVCDDDLGRNLVRVERIRALNPRARIVCRVFHEEAAKVLERAPFECVLLSTSRQAVNALLGAGVFRELGIDSTDARSATSVSGSCLPSSASSS